MMGSSFEEMLSATVRVAVREEVKSAMREALAEIKPEESGELMSVKAAAHHAKVDTKTIRNWIKAGKLSPLWAGTRRRVRKDELARCLERPPESEAEGTPDGAAAAVLRQLRGGG